MAYLVGILVGAFVIAILATLFVDFNDKSEAGSEDVDIDEIDISFEDIK